MIYKLKRVAYVAGGRRTHYLWVLNSSDIGRGFAPRQSLSFSHVDVGDAFQIINHISANPYRPTDVGKKESAVGARTNDQGK